MIRKKFCKQCGKRFEDDTNSFHCPSCTKLNEERCKKPIVEYKSQPGNITFSVKKSWSDKETETVETKLLGLCERDKKDGHMAIRINLFNFDKLKPDVYIDIINTVSHESLHVAIALSSDWNTSKMADNGLLKKLESEGYL